MDFKVNVSLSFTQQRITDLLICAFEGGSNYWYVILTKSHKDKNIYECPFLEDGYLLIADKEEDDCDGWYLNRKTIQIGLQTMADKYPRHFGDFINENDDATTGDVFLQCCLFEEVRFG